jgi:FMN-dependent NADH-azoreductase
MKILHIISSPRGEDSISIKLGNAIVDKLKEVNPESEVTVRNVAKNPYPHIDQSHIKAFFATPEQFNSEDAEAAKYSDEAIGQVLDSDVIVIGAPMYNYGIHSSLKVWIDHIVRVQKTVSFSESGSQGLINGKKLYVAMTTGAVFTEGYYQPFDFIEPYLRAVFSLIGITDVTVYRAEGLNIPGVKENALDKALESIVI